MRQYLTVLLPGAGLALAAAIMGQLSLSQDWQIGLQQVYPVTVLLAGIGLGWRFDRGRVVGAALLLIACERALGAAAAVHGPDAIPFMVLVRTLAILLPLNLAQLCLSRDSGVVSLHGGLRFFGLLLQAAAVFVLYRHPLRHACEPVTRWLLAPTPLPVLGITLWALLPTLVGCALILMRFVSRRSALDGGFLWALLMAAAAVGSRTSPDARTLWLATAGLTLVIGLIETSYGMAFRDELTGLPARRALREAAGRLGGRFALGMVDVDRFKRFNDTYGHDVGDQVLKLVAARLARVGGGGKAFRYGGEEFTVLFAGHDAAHAARHLDAVRAELAEWDFVLRAPGRPRRRPEQPPSRKRPSKKTRITVSAGVAAAQPGEDGFDAVIRAADAALYKAKRSGRNRVCTA